MRTIDDAPLNDKYVLVRVDFNVPIKEGRVENDARIRKAIPTIEKILELGAKKIILCSHLGRPGGKYDEKYSMRPVYERLKEDFDNIGFDEIFDLKNLVREDLPETRIVLIENLRFEQGEKENHLKFASSLASLADIFVFDAFGVAHREQASVTGVMKYLPTYFGYLMAKEVLELKDHMKKPEHPFTAIISGAKADKINIINNLLKKIDNLIIGGVLANTFLKAKGYNIGESKFDEEGLEFAKKVMKDYPKKVDIPEDVLLADKFDERAETKYSSVEDIEDGWIAVDIGPKTIESYTKILKKSKTIIMAGPIGVFEVDEFSNGTKSIGKVLANSKAKTIIGGGDTVAAIEKFGLQDDMTHVSTGGGASLELLGGNDLPAISELENNIKKFP
jgi:phosphoglycerate kinase